MQIAASLGFQTQDSFRLHRRNLDGLMHLIASLSKAEWILLGAKGFKLKMKGIRLFEHV